MPDELRSIDAPVLVVVAGAQAVFAYSDDLDEAALLRAADEAASL